ncbi:MAG: metal-independent alpha-mannosidase [Ignavibacteria bacterium GWB2_36_8]|nr:MAG: metal-independent alpha-mannosidase [Ignavibacteria bacterium GWB2_36_8]
MFTRREFIKTTGISIAGIGLSNFSSPLKLIKENFMSQRPKPEDRKFVSEIVEKTIVKVKQSINDDELARLFENCYPNTLDTTVNFKIENDKPDTFVITGDINAMWLRDSTTQVWSYLSLAVEDGKLKEMLKGVINRQTECILIDPYANAFNNGPTGSEWEKDITQMKPELHERKWEIDSLCYPIRLSYGFWKATGDSSCFDDNWQKATRLILKTFHEQQRKIDVGPYSFSRTTSWSTDTVPGNGYGNPINPVGLIASIFRPSDDATIFPFLIPSNFFAVVSLRQLSEMYQKIIKDNEFASDCLSLALEVESALHQYAVANHLSFGKIYAYEVDGFGNKLFMDDANAPSLLSLPYLGCCPVNDPVYQNTRRFVFSKNNPYFFEGKAAQGVGSPHTLVNRIWHISIIMRALTSESDDEIAQCLNYLKTTHADTGFMHESFNKDDAGDFTRSWFAWANSLFGELILKLYTEKPALLKRIY